jgi:hypothetical protein
MLSGRFKVVVHQEEGDQEDQVEELDVEDVSVGGGGPDGEKSDTEEE